jgi:hypothetical protein
MNSQLLVGRIERYRRRDLLIDTNLLLLYFVGAFRPDRIRSFKRTSRYSIDPSTCRLPGGEKGGGYTISRPPKHLPLSQPECQI